VVLGVANLVADGLSMAASRFLGARADLERREVARLRERRHIALVPEGEREEVRQLLAAKGFGGEELNVAVDVITRDVDTWVNFMLTEELGLPPEADRPLVAATARLGCLRCVGLTPMAFCVVGILKARVVGSDPRRAEHAGCRRLDCNAGFRSRRLAARPRLTGSGPQGPVSTRRFRLLPSSAR